MRSLFYFLILLIAYGSFYPFNLQWADVHSDRVALLLNFSFLNSSLSDLISNIVLFIPFGLVFSHAFPDKSLAKQTLKCIGLGFAIAYLIQVGQLWTLGRIPWGGDAIWNTCGCLLGVALSRVVKLSRIKSYQEQSSYITLAYYLGLGIVLLKLAPFSPTLDFHLLKANIRALILDPQVDIFWAYENIVTWVLAFYLLTLAKIKWANTKNFTLLAVGILSLKFFIISNDINLSQFVGAAVALVIWGSLRRFISLNVLALALTLSIIGNGLYPFELRADSINFNWIPFTGSLNGNILLNILAISKKAIFYTCLLWLVYLNNKQLLRSTLLIALLIFIAEFSQTFFTNSVPEITDPILVLIAGYVLHLLNVKTTIPSSSNITPLPVIPQPAGLTTTVPATLNIPALDGLRAIAALSVFIVHFQQFTGLEGSLGPIDFERWMINGNTGVALFFTLSGFLLSISFWQASLSNKLPNIKTYFVHRAARIIPLYYLCLFGILGLNGFGGADANFENIISHIFFVYNLKDHQVMSINPPFWTLAVEMQFYLLLPVFFIILRGTSKAIATALLCLLIPFIFLLYQLLMSSLAEWTSWPIKFPLIWPFGIEIGSVKAPSLTYSTFAHLPHFLIGVVTASLYLSYVKSKKQLSTLLEVVFWIATVCLALILSTDLDEFFQVDYGRYNFPAVPILLGIILFTAPNTVFAKVILNFPILNWIGRISYGIYIFHYPLQKATKLAFDYINLDLGNNVFIFAFISLTVTLVLSHISYVYFEKPIINAFKKNKTTYSGDVETADNNFRSVSTAPPNKLMGIYIRSSAYLKSIIQSSPLAAYIQWINEKALVYPILVICGLTSVLLFIAGDDTTPYNVKELFNQHAVIQSAFLISLTVFVAIGFPKLCAASLVKKNKLTLLSLVFCTLLHTLFLFHLVYFTFPLESIWDILGYPVLKDVSDYIEYAYRFTGFYLPISAIFFLAHCWLMKSPTLAFTSARLGFLLIFTAIIVPISFYIVVVKAGTDNIIELLPNNGYSFKLLYLLGYLILLITLSLCWIKDNRPRDLWSRLTLLLLSILSMPIGYFMVKNGLQSLILKYDMAFSALQFLMSSSRSKLLEEQQIFQYFMVLHVTIMAGLYVVSSSLQKNRLVNKTPFSDKSFAIPEVNIFEQPSPTLTVGETSYTKPQSLSMAPLRKYNIVLIISLLIGTLLTTALIYALQSNQTIKIESISWASQKANMIFDHHTHTKYSNGSLDLAELSNLAQINGCDAFAITDHSGVSGSLTLDKIAKVKKLRKQFPDMLILNGIEVGLPSYDEREQINIITTPKFEAAILPAIMTTIEEAAVLPVSQQDEYFFATILQNESEFSNTIAIYNHPSRKNEKASENLADIISWNKNRRNITAISGTLGHQKDEQIGSYNNQFKTSDRWGPAIANIGGTWDKLLEQGIPLWGAIASSGYHNAKIDYPPCGFARIHVIAPTKDYDGLLQSLKTGTFWAGHGNVIEQLQLSLEIDGSPSLVYSGESAILPKSQTFGLVTVKIARSEIHKNSPLSVDIISNCSSGQSEVINESYILTAQNETKVIMSLNLSEKNSNKCFVRARVIKDTLEKENLVAYTNPIMIRLN
jgi:peptidoglycan/LPS O-acetylase OafA/YrhL